jgi:hypothetical protein
MKYFSIIEVDAELKSGKLFTLDRKRNIIAIEQPNYK